MDEIKLIEGPAPLGWMRRCILFSPSSEYEAWLSVIGPAALDAGFELVVIHGEAVGPVEGVDRRIFATTNKKFLEPAADADLVVIYGNVASAIAATAYLTGSDHPTLYTVMDASALLVEALTLPGARLVTDRMLKAAGSDLEIFSGLTVTPPEPSRHDPVNAIDDAGRRALAMYAEGFPAVDAEIDLGLDLFFYDTRRQDLRDRITLMDITGGPRMLVNGPQLTLTPGRWEMTVNIGLDEEAAQRRMAIEWGTLDEPTGFESAPGRPGVFKAVLTHVWDAPARGELRIRLAEGAMAGEFEFLGAKLRRVG